MTLNSIQLFPSLLSCLSDYQCDTRCIPLCNQLVSNSDSKTVYYFPQFCELARQFCWSHQAAARGLLVSSGAWASGGSCGSRGSNQKLQDFRSPRSETMPTLHSSVKANPKTNTIIGQRRQEEFGGMTRFCLSMQGASKYPSQGFKPGQVKERHI